MTPEPPNAEPPELVTLFLAGDVMTGRGVDQVLPHPGDAEIHESYIKSAIAYVTLAERANGPIARPVAFDYIWGDALGELDRRQPGARIVNLETAITRSSTPEPKGINYKMNPANAEVISEAGIDCCVLANNHVLDWGTAGLIETLSTLDQAGVRHAGAGRDDIFAAAPAILAGAKGGRFLVFSFAGSDSGTPCPWSARTGKPGVNMLRGLSAQAADEIGETIRARIAPGSLVIASIHWGSNWGHKIPNEQVAFAHRLVESSSVDIVHGHSSHHARAIDVHCGKLILYGCGDFIDDYEGISGYEAFRGDLVLMYFPTLRVRDGKLVSLEMVPLQIRRMRLNHASRSDAQWLAETLNRECRVFGTHIALGPENVMTLDW